MGAPCLQFAFLKIVGVTPIVYGLKGTGIHVDGSLDRTSNMAAFAPPVGSLTRSSPVRRPFSTVRPKAMATARPLLHKTDARSGLENPLAWPSAKDRERQTYMMDEMIGVSIAIRCVRATVERFATCQMPLVLIGETGTGKSRLARLLAAEGPREHAPFVTVDAAALDASGGDAAALDPRLRASSGCGSWEEIAQAWIMARGGTLFIDHVGETPASLQLHLSGLLRRARQSKTAHPRLIVANQHRLEGAVAVGTFNRMLFEQVHHLAIHLPALRHRPEDIPLLAEHFLRQQASPRQKLRLSFDAVTRLQNHLWPGNIRELNNVLRCALVLANDRSTLQSRDIVFDARGFAAQSSLLSRQVRPSATP